MATLLLLINTLIASATACEITPHRVVFQPGMGTHTAYYCKANEDEKKMALEEMKQIECVKKKLEGKKVLREEAINLKPSWFTKEDAKKSGPILEIKLILQEVKTQENIAKRSGYRAIASGRTVLIMPPTGTGGISSKPITVTTGYDFDSPMIFEQNCPPSGCVEGFSPLCN